MGLKKAFQNLLASWPRSGDGEPGVARREHEGENAVDDDQREGRGHGINPADRQVQLLVDLAPGVVVDRDGGQLDDEEDPLHGPAEDEVMNQRAGGLRVRQADGEPDAHAADRAEDAGEDQEELGVAGQLLEPRGAQLALRHAQGLALGHGQIESAAHGKLRDHDVEDGDDADHPARAEISECPRMDSSLFLLSPLTESSSSR